VAFRFVQRVPSFARETLLEDDLHHCLLCVVENMLATCGGREAYDQNKVTATILPWQQRNSPRSQIHNTHTKGPTTAQPLAATLTLQAVEKRPNGGTAAAEPSQKNTTRVAAGENVTITSTDVILGQAAGPGTHAIEARRSSRNEADLNAPSHFSDEDKYH
jgi:antitoxin (DNA-binding transcriptional repressor) of toxin-antitoxin stability system